MNNDYWAQASKRVNALLAPDDVDGIVSRTVLIRSRKPAIFLDLVARARSLVCLHLRRDGGLDAISADGPIQPYNAVILAGRDEAVRKGVLVALQPIRSTRLRGNKNQHFDGKTPSARP